MKAGELMSSPPVTVRTETTLKETARLMSTLNLSALPVVTSDGELVGIVSEADLLDLEAATDPRAQLIPAVRMRRPKTVGDVMSSPVITCDQDTDVGIAAQRLLDAHVKRLPVVRGRAVVGVISRHDLIEVLARDDGAIREAVERRLNAESATLSALAVCVEGGLVKLSGTTDPTSLKLAASVARTVAGVLDVETAQPTPGGS